MAASSNAADSIAELKERFARQVILPGIGVEGQQKWARTPILLAAEDPVLEAASTAFTSAGAPLITLLKDPSDVIPPGSAILILTQNKVFRRALSRRFRSLGQPAFFAWPMGTGWALFLASPKAGQCPCLECFEIMNPKAFGEPAPGVPRLMAAMAVSEVLQWILKPESPLEGKVWVTSLESGVSFLHEVLPTYKCTARLLAEGAPVTP